ncbi:MAG: tetratricopeptide repeat protein [Bacteroidales bacterium]|nr:tetratricopeptide repeat protein [Bacteroidales bacterium]MDD4529526.1 tetratricopeptide repeat protein [Bacteroidales bacterium]MDD4829909.1 tetratricopeptide repeat protein [Bacteroidales bacterium]
MSEDFDDIDDTDLNKLIQRFEDCITTKQGCFFDIDELLEVIDYYFAVDENKKIKSAINLALQLYPNEIEILIRKAQVIAQDKTPDEAINFLLKFKEFNPEDPDLLFALASLYSQSGRRAKAIENYKKLLVQDNQDIEVYSSLGEEYFAIENYDAAVKIYKKALNIEPTNSTLLQPFAYASQYIKNPNLSIEFLKKLCKKNPFSEQNWIGYGLALYYTEKYFDAITALELALAINDKNPISHLYKAQSLIAIDNVKEGISSLHDAHRIDPTEPLVLFFLGQAHEKQNNWTAAASYYKDCIKFDQFNSDAWIGVGMCYFEQDDFHSAEPYIIKAIEIEPTNVQHRLAYAEMLYKENYIEKSEELYQTLYEEGNELALVTINWALVMDSSNKSMDAIHLLRETIDNNKIDEPSLYFNFIELSLKEDYLKDHLIDYVFKLLFEFDITIEMIEKHCPTLLISPQYETLIKTYIDEKN